jgi:hypothetical protein
VKKEEWVVNRNLLLIVLSLCFAVSLFGRDVEVLVEDTELGLPLEGAVLRSWDGRQYVCDDEGRAMVSVPEGRQVVIQAVYPGYENGRLVIPVSGDSFTLGLRLSGVLQNRELVLEAERPGSGETRTGRSVALSAQDIAQTAEIGIIEDVMSSIKLLPGVAYTGLFNAQPSIRGGDPNDMSASLDGFYIFNPYHWGGGFSIFDPRMVESAQLSHGVFSSRYGHTISGLLEITSKNPSPTELELEWGSSTSAFSLNLSVPLKAKGGILFMGRLTRYDPIIYLAKQLAKKVEILEPVKAINTAPYIRSGTIAGNYRFTDNLNLNATAFFGMDGVGVKFNADTAGSYAGNTNALFDYTNYQAFVIAGLSWNPRNDMLLKFTTGAGYTDAVAEGNMQNSIGEKPYSDSFRAKYPELNLPATYNFYNKSSIDGSDSLFNVQGRIDYDWEPGNGFLVAAGVQEMFSRYSSNGDQKILPEGRFSNLKPDLQDLVKALAPFPEYSNIWADLRISRPITWSYDARNNLFTTSGFVLGEYVTPGKRFAAELGLRIDHFVLSGKGIFMQSKPALNPRLNVDFNVFKNKGWLESFDLSAGTGLFSSVNDNIFIAEERYNIKELKPNRSWTSVVGTKLEFPHSIILNVEAYYKYVFGRMYATVQFGIDDVENVDPHFNGIGRVWGIDIMLRKAQSRYFDGWISYSYSWAKYRDPDTVNADRYISGGSRGSDWYFPGYHRFHNLNLVLNIKPTPRINFYTRFGLASGTQLSRRVTPQPVSYPVFVFDPDDPFNSEKNYFIEKYSWPSVSDENNRTTPTLSMDIKFSISGKNDYRKTRYEIYMAVENVLSLVYSSKGNTSYNSYTGEENPSTSASYGIPIPVPSFGFTYSY